MILRFIFTEYYAISRLRRRFRHFIFITPDIADTPTLFSPDSQY
jgi:hypothetical protein